MKILCVIDSFGSGGGQRQIINLALGLKNRGHQVEFFIYYPDLDFFRPLVDNAGIPVHLVQRSKNGFSFNVCCTLFRLIRRRRFDAVIAFLGAPSIYAELAKIGAPQTALIVSERGNYQGEKSAAGAILKRALHVFADKVVANSHSQAAWLDRMKWLWGRSCTIYNGIEIGAERTPPSFVGLSDLKIVAVGRVGPEKNVLNVIQSLIVLHDRYGNTPSIQWVGRRDTSAPGAAFCRKVDDLLLKNPHIATKWEWLGERKDIPAILTKSHLLIHASFHEGLPNAVCEALAAGRIVLASNVCDHARLVGNGKWGFLFDPKSPEQIADAIDKASNLTPSVKQKMSEQARKFAKDYLSTEVMVDSYMEILQCIVNGKLTQARQW